MLTQSEKIASRSLPEMVTVYENSCATQGDAAMDSHAHTLSSETINISIDSNETSLVVHNYINLLAY